MTRKYYVRLVRSSEAEISVEAGNEAEAYNLASCRATDNDFFGDSEYTASYECPLSDFVTIQIGAPMEDFSTIRALDESGLAVATDEAGIYLVSRNKLKALVRFLKGCGVKVATDCLWVASLSRDINIF